MALYTLERNVVGNYFLHFLLDTCNIIQTNGTVQMQRTVITLRYGMFQGNASLRIKLFYCFDKDETKRSEIGTHARRISYIKKLNIFIVIYLKVEPFYLIVNFRTDRSVGHF